MYKKCNAKSTTILVCFGRFNDSMWIHLIIHWYLLQLTLVHEFAGVLRGGASAILRTAFANNFRWNLNENDKMYIRENQFNWFSRMYILSFSFKFHRKLFSRALLTINQHWFRYWLCVAQPHWVKRKCHKAGMLHPLFIMFVCCTRTSNSETEMLLFWRNFLIHWLHRKL